jgi:hypothetical protein
MAEIVIRRRRATADRMVNEIVVPVTDRKLAASRLHAILHDVQRERGSDAWSDADPEVLVDGAAVGRLRRHETIEDLVKHVLEWVRDE